MVEDLPMQETPKYSEIRLLVAENFCPPDSPNWREYVIPSHCVRRTERGSSGR